MKHKLLIIFAFSLFVTACKNDKPSAIDTPIVNEDIKKDISELSYMDIYMALFTDNNGGFDAHGDLYGQDAISIISITEESSSCGKVLFLSNNSTTHDVTLAIKASFNFPGNPNVEMLRAYTLKSNEKISIGNSILCYQSKEYPIKRDIVSAGFVEN